VLEQGRVGACQHHHASTPLLQSDWWGLEGPQGKRQQCQSAERVECKCRDLAAKEEDGKQRRMGK